MSHNSSASSPLRKKPSSRPILPQPVGGGAVDRDQDDRHVQTLLPAEPAEELLAIHHRHDHVQQDQVDVAPDGELIESVLPVEGPHQGVTPLGEEYLQVVLDVGIVLDDEDALHAALPPRGSVTVTVVPRLSPSEVTLILPPRSSTIFLTRERPMPLPSLAGLTL